MQRIGIGISDVGQVRTNNEDSIFVFNNKIGMLPNLYIVADGMGGHNAGEVASAKSIDFLNEYALNCSNNESIESLLFQGTKIANEKVFALSVENEAQKGMGTTFTACVIEDENLYYVHVGDSRLYLISKDGIKQITEDHTFVNEMVKLGDLTKAEAQNHPKRNMLTRALGSEESTQIEVGCLKLSEEQSILICSDGLTNMLADEEIFKIMDEETENSVKVENLINKANNNGGFDNVSVVII